MSKVFSIVKGFFVKRGSDWIILIISLFIAFVMWSMLRLSQTYSTTLKYDVKIHTSIKGRASWAVSKDPVIVRGRTSGFSILQNSYLSKNNMVEVNVDPKLVRKVQGKDDLFFVSSSDIKENIQQALDNELSIDNITFDSLFFYLYRQAYKKVPVVAKSNITFARQYINVGGIVLKPDSVFVYGKAALIENIDSVVTKNIGKDKAKKEINGMIAIEPVENVSFSQSEVFYSLNVERYFEDTFTIPLEKLNPPAQEIIPVPDEIQIKVKAANGGPSKIKSTDFKAYINYDNPVSKGNGSGYAKVEVYGYPSGVIDVKPNPLYVKIY